MNTYKQVDVIIFTIKLNKLTIHLQTGVNGILKLTPFTLQMAK